MTWTHLKLCALGVMALGTAAGAAARAGQPAAPPPQKIVVSTPQVKDVVLTQAYAAKVRGHRHVEVRTVVDGVVTDVTVKEGQAVKKGEVLFKLSPLPYRAELEAELADLQLAKLEADRTKQLFEKKAATAHELALREAVVAKAEARVNLAKFKLDMTAVRAPFDGSVGRFQQQEGSVVKEGEALTTLTDNSVLWVYFPVPEARYLEYAANRKAFEASPIELGLANGTAFAHTGKLGAVEPTFHDENGTISFRADFPNPDRLLQHGQTGTVRLSRPVKDALTVPQSAIFERRGKLCVYVVDKDGVAGRREVTVSDEVGTAAVIKSGLEPTDRIVVAGVLQVSDGDKLEYEFRKPEDVSAPPKRGTEK